MAIDFSAPRTDELRLPFGLSWISAIPARFVLAGIVSASFLVRLTVALAHATPLYFPDEYIYASIARSLAEHGRPLIRHSPAHFPALLEPLLAAPFWLFHDPALAYRLTQAENALAMSLAAIPVYLLSKKLGLGIGLSLVAAALAVASPNLFFVSFVLADPLAYPLVLGALYAAVCALSQPSRPWQVAFVVLWALTALTRIQYALLPLVFEPIQQQRKIDVAAGGAEAARVPLQCRQLVAHDQVRVVQQTTDQRRFAVVDRAAGEDTQEALVGRGEREPAIRHQK